MINKVGTLLITSLLLAVLVLSVVSVNAFAATGGVTEAEVQQDLVSLRKATVRYLDVNNALADGFVPVSECILNSDGSAGMGIHYMHIGRVVDPSINLLEPELLLYAPTQNGVRLVGVEYFQAIGPANFIPPDAPPPPMLFGREFDGPMFGHEEVMPSHYDFHVWLWVANPNGIFADFNPNVKCP
ncbi:MAG: hypothetical protein ACYC3H_04485 [Bellilinea sp.]